MQTIPDSIDLSAYLKEPEPGERVIPASSLEQDVVDAFCLPTERQGDYLPWPKTRRDFRFRQGEVTLWLGINGHGKSLVTGQVALDLCAQDSRVCIASLEMKPVKTMQRMTRQASAQKSPDIAFIRALHRWTDGRLWIYDQLGMIEPAKVIAVIRYCYEQLGMRHFFLDSLMKCVRGDDDYNGQKDFVNQLCAVAMDTGMHIHLIHHAKKMANEREVPGKFDAKGSGSITDQVDNVMTVWRNKKKEADRQKGSGYDDTEPDACIICDKQRNGDWEGMWKLWFDHPSSSYCENGIDPPLPYDIPIRQPGDDDE